MCPAGKGMLGRVFGGKEMLGVGSGACLPVQRVLRWGTVGSSPGCPPPAPARCPQQTAPLGYSFPASSLKRPRPPAPPQRGHAHPQCCRERPRPPRCGRLAEILRHLHILQSVQSVAASTTDGRGRVITGCERSCFCYRRVLDSPPLAYSQPRAHYPSEVGFVKDGRPQNAGCGGAGRGGLCFPRRGSEAASP